MTEPRDAFALEAMKILLDASLRDGSEDYTWQEIAEEAYCMADAMMKARLPITQPICRAA